MLAGKFYTVTQQEQTSETISTAIAWNAAHPIFEGHFPGQPVVPGVCMMQTIQEILGNALQKNVMVRKASNMKFLNMIDPNKQPAVDVEIKYAVLETQELKVTAQIKSSELIFLKFQGLFTVKQ
ncbi:3-hydroxyacyl-ACP dehydratase [Chitinophaga horti]|uniref:3-hydroxyacyl-ACP dehydratase n=1 Tax=Chitinophaga horti TaxID=2920382 RepID=A0ABY6J5N1_9BACT|nr:3-hydroxyacyl-ACP dehydratase [Chitinophaga horti]UYQ93892.1 3-hydroxyacyl-ACP dehydratase [Chitinophaga horti]